MKDLIIGNHVIKKDIKEILYLLKSHLTNGKLSQISFKGDEVSVTCPFHNDGKENKPSCFIYVGENKNLQWGTFHCLACNESGNIIKFIAGCLDSTNYYAEQWLKKYFTLEIRDNTSVDIDDEIKLKTPVKRNNKNILDESILDKFQSWHPYIEQRKISKEIANKFQIKYDPITKTIVFPVRDIKGNLIFLTKRSIQDKKFYIDSNAEKIVYLLDEAVKNNLNQVIVVESQINALVSYTYGFPAVALFGVGTTEEQIKELNKTNIIHYILMYDNDEAGRKGAFRFKNLIKKDVFVTDIIMPKNKDVADCSKEEFWDILRKNNILLD